MDFDSKSEFWSEVQRKVDSKDVVLVASVPVILTLIFFLFLESYQSSMALDYGNPSIPTFFTHTLIHGSVSHLTGNVFVYILAAVSALIMSALSGEKRLFYAMFLVFIFVFPFVLSGIEVHYIHADKPGRGFSGISAAFLGLIPISLVLFLKDKVSREIRKDFALSFLLIVLGTAGFIYADALLSRILSLGGITALAAFFMWRSLRSVDVEGIKQDYRSSGRTESYIWLGTLSAIIFLLGSATLFPQQIRQEGKLVNVISHYFGFALGYIVPYFTLEGQRLLGRREFT